MDGYTQVGPSILTRSSVNTVERSTFNSSGRDMTVHNYYHGPVSAAEPQNNSGVATKAKLKTHSQNRGRAAWAKVRSFVSFLALMLSSRSRRALSRGSVAAIVDLTLMDLSSVSSAYKKAVSPPRKSTPEIYSRLLSLFGLGYPLYQPSSVPATTSRGLGVRIGDVGVVTHGGTFDVIFNVCSDRSRILDIPNLPCNLQPLTCHEISKHQQFQPKNYLLSEGIKQTSNSPNSYTCIQEEGAILELPAGAICYEARNTRAFRDLAARHAMVWYKYMVINKEMDVRNGSLLIVTGYIKSHNWGIAVFNRASDPEDRLLFIVEDIPGIKGKPKFYWRSSGSVLSRIGPDPVDGITAVDGEPNQCIFLRGYQIVLTEKEWGKLNRGTSGTNVRYRSAPVPASRDGRITRDISRERFSSSRVGEETPALTSQSFSI